MTSFSSQFRDTRTANLIEELNKMRRKYTELVGELELLERRVSTLATSIVMHKKAQEAYEEVCIMFSQQVRIAQQIKPELHERDK